MANTALFLSRHYGRKGGIYLDLNNGFLQSPKDIAPSFNERIKIEKYDSRFIARIDGGLTTNFPTLKTSREAVCSWRMETLKTTVFKSIKLIAGLGAVFFVCKLWIPAFVISAIHPTILKVAALGVALLMARSIYNFPNSEELSFWNEQVRTAERFGDVPTQIAIARTELYHLAQTKQEDLKPYERLIPLLIGYASSGETLKNSFLKEEDSSSGKDAVLRPLVTDSSAYPPMNGRDCASSRLFNVDLWLSSRRDPLNPNSGEFHTLLRELCDRAKARTGAAPI